MISAYIGFFGFTLFVIVYTVYKLRKDNFSTAKGYFLAGKSLTGPIIAGSMILTNISTEHLIGMNGSSYKNGIIVIAWEVTSAIALGIAAISALLTALAWRFKRHTLDDSQIMVMSGLLAPKSQFASRVKLHSAQVSQGPIARWRGYATLHLGLAGGDLSIPGIPLERAREVRSEVLKTIAETDFSALENGSS